MGQRFMQRPQPTQENRPSLLVGWADALRNSVDAFYRSIADESWRTSPQPYASFEDGFRGMAFVEACVRSSKERRWVKVEQL